MAVKPIPLSREGRAALEAELKELVEVKRPIIVQRVSTARAEGDLSENFAYHDARQELGMLDGRVQTIEATLRHAVIVETAAADGRVHLGSEVRVRDEFGDSVYSIVGPAEADITKGKVSIESPLGASLLDHEVGDEVSFQTPGGERKATIVAIN